MEHFFQDMSGLPPSVFARDNAGPLGPAYQDPTILIARPDGCAREALDTLMAKLEDLIQAWRGPTDIRSANGSVLVCHWPSEGCHAFLHELYPAIDVNSRTLVRERFGFEIPASYDAFLSEHNGARLFLNTVSMAGVISEVYRSTELDQAQPVSLLDLMDVFAVSDEETWEAGWRRVGEITVENQWSVELNGDGAVAVLRSRKSKLFASVWDFLSHVYYAITPSFALQGERSIAWDNLDLALQTALE